MVAFSFLLVDPEAVNGFLRDAHGDLRAALICWGIVLSAFIILRIPRKVLLGCLIVAAATVGLAATMIDVIPIQPSASAPRPQPAPANYRAAVQRGGFEKAMPNDWQPF
jgi:hypothetical protein